MKQCLVNFVLLFVVLGFFMPVMAEEAEEVMPKEERLIEAVSEMTEEDDADSIADVEEVEELDLQETVGWLKLESGLRDGPIPLAWVPESEAGPSLESVLRQMDYVAAREHYLGMVIFFDGATLTRIQVDALVAGIQKLQDAGKVVIAFAEMYSTSEYLLASACDKVVLQHKGEIDLRGFAMQEMFLAGVFEKIGAKADILQVGQYKGASEQYVNKQPSEAWNKNIDGLLDDLYGQMTEGLSERRGVSESVVDGWMGRTWLLDNDEYVKEKLIDELADRDLVSVTEIAFGDEFIWDKMMGESDGSDAPAMNANNPFAIFQLLFQTNHQVPQRDSLAVVHMEGPIHSGESSFGDGRWSDASIGSKSMVKLLSQLRQNEHVKGVLVRIDSPGGSALASEMIWQAMRRLGEEKPVFVVVQGMAASGGYYIACSGQEIYVSPGSIVGSIGVVGGKLVFGEMFEKIGLNVNLRTRGGMSGMMNVVKPFDATERELVREGMTKIYEQFRDRVRTGRGSRLKDLDAVDEGMLFAGTTALDYGMVDHLGGVRLALSDLATEAELEDDGYDVLHYPEAMSLQEYLNELFGVQSGGLNVKAMGLKASMKELLGANAYRRVANVMDGLMLLRHEPVLTVMPSALIIDE
ncbi:S49 family peptidase [Poriferisphaera sp. WC338]|uniref:S49 family peptidase n=1 Tax=Poriferisphaera sp. WC338 TaxID=3425129 RepID=UPI003D814355